MSSAPTVVQCASSGTGRVRYVMIVEQRVVVRNLCGIVFERKALFKARIQISGIRAFVLCSSFKGLIKSSVELSSSR